MACLEVLLYAGLIDVVAIVGSLAVCRMGFIPYAYEIKGSDDFNVFFIFSWYTVYGIEYKTVNLCLSKCEEGF